MALQGMTLSEISLTEKDKCYMILLNVESQNKQKTNPSIDNREQFGGCQRQRVRWVKWVKGVKRYKLQL